MNEQNNYAGFWRRFCGWLIDSIILYIIIYRIYLLLSSFFESQLLNVLANGSIFSFQFFAIFIERALLVFAIIAIYYVLFEASTLQATVGKLIVGIKVTDMQGSRLTYLKAFLRRVYSILSTLIIGIGYIIAGFNSKKQTLHDMLAKTVVVIKRKINPLILIIILILTLILGAVANKYLGDNSPLYSITTQSSSNATELDPVLENVIVSAFMSQKEIYASGDIIAIRSHISTALSSLQLTPQQQQMLNLSDSDLKNMAVAYTKISILATDSTLRSPQTIWTFNQDKTAVQISFQTTLSNGIPETISIYMLNNDGQWYF